MCRLCGESDCHNSDLCGLKHYRSIRNFQTAIRRVQRYEYSFQSRSFGLQVYPLRHGYPRPAHSIGVWNHFNAMGNRGYICPYCNRYLRGGHQIDHIVPWERYIRSVLGLAPDAEGDIPQFVAGVLVSDPQNLHVICSPCNASKGTKAKGDPGFDEWVASRRRWAEEEDEDE